MTKHKTIEENFDTFMYLGNDLASLNIIVSEDHAIQILTNLPSWDQISLLERTETEKNWSE